MVARYALILMLLAPGISTTLRAEPVSVDSWNILLPQAGPKPRLLGPGVISTGDDESHPTVSPDGRRLYFLKNTPSFDFWTIVYSDRTDDGWTRPKTVPFSGQFADADLAFTQDGARAYFISRRPVNGKPRTDTEIWTIQRNAAGEWSEPEHVTALSSPGDEWFPTPTADGTLYFGSDRPGGVGGSDIYRARMKDDSFLAPENLGAPVNTTAEEIEAFVTPDERLLIVAAKNRGDSLGAYDLYLARRTRSEWSAPRNLGAPINSAAWEFSPRLSPDGKLLLFTSNRGFSAEPLHRPLSFDELERKIRSPGNGLRDIYVVRTDSLLP